MLSYRKEFSAMTGKKFPNYKDRLLYLCSRKGINAPSKNIPRKLARAFMAAGLIHDDGDVENKRKMIASDLQRDPGEHLPGDHIDLYCRFFGCSADFLLGYIDTPTYEEKALAELTGLSERGYLALLAKDPVIIKALDLLLPDIRKALAYDPIRKEDEASERELAKYNLFGDIAGYLTSKEAKVVSSGFEGNIDVNGAIDANGAIFFSDESGNITGLDPRQISAVFMLSIQEELQRIGDSAQK